MTLLAVAFFVTAGAYAAVGFGGGSTYNALLVLAGTDYRLIPLIALTCNIIVVAGNIGHFGRLGYIRFRSALPWMLFSVPCSFIGGLLPVSEYYFIVTLGCALAVSGVYLLLPDNKRHCPVGGTVRQMGWLAPLLGSGLGLLAGITGIGGGIFLAPALHFLRWSDARVIAATCSLFIFLNSMAGLAGQLVKHDGLPGVADLVPYAGLAVAVCLGGQIGAWLGAGWIGVHVVRKMTGALVLYVAIRLLWRAAGAG